MKDVAQGEAEDVLGAAEDGSVKVLIVRRGRHLYYLLLSHGGHCTRCALLLGPRGGPLRSSLVAHLYNVSIFALYINRIWKISAVAKIWRRT